MDELFGFGEQRHYGSRDNLSEPESPWGLLLALTMFLAIVFLVVKIMTDIEKTNAAKKISTIESMLQENSETLQSEMDDIDAIFDEIDASTQEAIVSLKSANASLDRIIANNELIIEKLQDTQPQSKPQPTSQEAP